MRKDLKRIWIYQASRFFTDEEVAAIKADLSSFVSDWTAHGNKLAASVDVLHRLFIVLQVDESLAHATGCSIDKSVHLLKALEQRLGVTLFDRLTVAYRDGEGAIQLANRAAFQQLVNEGNVHGETFVFNNMITSADDFPHLWEVPLSNSWHANYLRASPD